MDLASQIDETNVERSVKHKTGARSEMIDEFTLDHRSGSVSHFFQKTNSELERLIEYLDKGKPHLSPTIPESTFSRLTRSPSPTPRSTNSTSCRRAAL